MIIDDLRAGTSHVHQSLEKILIPKIKQTHTKKGYLQLLHVFYGFYQPLEHIIHLYLGKDEIADIDLRRKSFSLAGDIQYIAPDSSTFVTCQDLPEIKTAAQAIGALYVIEGSTLGGKIISKIFRDNLLLDDSALTFFNSYGSNTNVMWQNFVGYINDYSNDGDEIKQMVASAKDTFTKFRTWIENN